MEPTILFERLEIDPHRWESIQPLFEELQQRPLLPGQIRAWLSDWSRLEAHLWEAATMIYIDKSLNTADAAKEQAFLRFIDDVSPKIQVATQALKERLLALENPGDELADMALVLRDMRNEADLYREANIPLFTELAKLDNEYDKLTGGLTAVWEGQEMNLSQLARFLSDHDRAVREQAWRTINQLWQSSREALNDIYRQMVELRRQVADNAGLPDYRAFAFREQGRFDYTPEDCLTFHEAIETVVVPAVRRLLARKRERLGYDRLRPWDWIPERNVLAPDNGHQPLAPYSGQSELIQRGTALFQRLDPELGRYFGTMAAEELLDLDTRPGKALGGYCSTLAVRKRPFIFMNGVGIHDDVQTLLHEAGHAFHVFETAALPLIWQTRAPLEFCEVASMSMELLAAPLLSSQPNGFYTPAEAARARIEHLQGIITFLPYMAVVDAFQHWVYTHAEAALDPSQCDAAWDAQWRRFIPDVDWRGFETVRRSGWHRKPHIFGSPFYYIEYGLAQVGALQIWRNSLADHAGTLAAYRRALALGGTRTLPELFGAAGAQFRFDAAMLGQLVALIESTVDELEKKL